MKPVRVQLRRTRGWRMPPNTVKVDRTTKWGNPFRSPDRATAVKFFGPYARLHVAKWAKQELRGKNLACWCPLGEPCHADVLLEIVN